MQLVDDDIREGVRFLKAQFLGWREPPIELPADHVLEHVVRALMQAGASFARQREQGGKRNS